MHVRHERPLALRAVARRPRRVVARRPRVATFREVTKKRPGAAARGRRRAVGRHPAALISGRAPAVTPVCRPARARARPRGAARPRPGRNAPGPTATPARNRRRAEKRSARRPPTRTIPGINCAVATDKFWRPPLTAASPAAPFPNVCSSSLRVGESTTIPPVPGRTSHTAHRGSSTSARLPRVARATLELRAACVASFPRLL